MILSRLLRVATVAGLATTAVAVPHVALADTPTRQTVPISFTFADAGFCSFPVREVITGEIEETRFPDGSQIWHIHRLSSFSANGRTVTSNADFTRFIDPSQPDLINDAGPIGNIQVPGYGAIYMQTGKLLLDLATGQVYFVAGPDDLVTPDGAAALCSYLSA